MNSYLYDGTVINALDKSEAIHKILAESTPRFLDVLEVFIRNLSVKQRITFKKLLTELYKYKSIKTEYFYRTDDNGVEWMTSNLAFDDGGEGIIYRTQSNSFYYTFEAANRIAKKLGARLPSKREWIMLALSKGGKFNDNEDSGFKQRDINNTVLENIEDVISFFNLQKYPGLINHLGYLTKEGQYAVYWSKESVGGGAQCEYIGHHFMTSNVLSKDAYLTVRLVK